MQNHDFWQKIKNILSSNCQISIFPPCHGCCCSAAFVASCSIAESISILVQCPSIQQDRSRYHTKLESPHRCDKWPWCEAEKLRQAACRVSGSCCIGGCQACCSQPAGADAIAAAKSTAANATYHAQTTLSCLLQPIYWGANNSCANARWLQSRTPKRQHEIRLFWQLYSKSKEVA